jgi:hypothetical protein
MNKYEQLIESILNEDEAAAKALFHDIVVAKSREIYESLMDEEMGGNPAQGFVQDITQQNDQAQDMGLGEDDLEGGEIELGGDDMGDEGFGDEETFGDDGAEMGGEEGGHEEITSKLDDLEAQLAELKSMLGGEEEGGMGGDDMGGEEGESDFDMDGGEEGSGMGSGSKSGEEELEETWNFEKKGSGKSGSGKSGSGVSGSGKSGSGKSGSGKTESYKRSEAEIMKEYVDRIGEIYKQQPAGGEGKEVGNGGSTNVSAKSIEGPGADFGGTNANIVKGGSEQNPDGKAYTKPKNIYSKGETTFSNEKFQNQPGANAGKTAFKTKEPGHGAEKRGGPEGKTTDGSVPVAKKSVQVQNTGRK